MSSYILARDYKGKIITGDEVSFTKGTLFTSKDNTIYYNSTPICFTTSQLAYEYFSDNEDSNGKLRGDYTFRIAYYRPPKQEGYRFSEEQIRVLTEYYPRYIRHDCDSIIFNDKFYHLPISTYEMMAQDLGIKLED